MPATRTVRYGPGPDQFIEVWEPAGAPAGSAVLIHGGYWRDRYGLDLMDPMAAHLASRGWQVWNVEYRRIAADDKGGVWDQLSADVRAALAAVDGDPVVVIGHSAGGQLALWAAADATQTLPPPASPRAAPRGRVDAVVALAPVADLAKADQLNLSDGAARLLLGGRQQDLPDLYREASPSTRLPLGLPQLVVHGDADDAVPLELSVDYGQQAIAAGDDVTLLNPSDVDHFHIIDPNHRIWRPIEDQLERWAAGMALGVERRDDASELNSGATSGADFDRISDEIGRFTAARGWDRYHNPKNLMLALVGEVGELSELFQWLSPHEAASPSPALRSDIEDEAADVLIYLIQLARKLDIDLLEAVEQKMAKNAERFPEL